MNSKNSNHAGRDRLEKATSVMRTIAVSEIPESVLEATRLEMIRESKNRKLRTTSVRFALAAVAILLVGLVLAPLLMRSTPAFAEVIQQVKATRNLRARIFDSEGHEGATIILSGTRCRTESESGVGISDLKTGDALSLDIPSKTAYRVYGQQQNEVVDLYQVIRGLALDAIKPSKDYVGDDGQRFPGFSGESSLSFGGDGSMKVDVTVWNDPKTKLPVRMKIRTPNENEMNVLFDRIEFDVPVDEGMFDMTIPTGYTDTSLSPDKLGPPPSEQEAEKLVITPKVGVGEVKFGMSREQITAVLGEPEATLHGTYLNYASKGLQLVLTGREPDKLGMIIANPVDAASLTRHDFRGRTDKGIGIGSTSQQIRDAYGAPNQSSTANQIGYGELGLGFSVVDGKVAQISASRTYEDTKLSGMESQAPKELRSTLTLDKLAEQKELNIDNLVLDLAAGIEKRQSSYHGLRFEYEASLTIKPAPGQEGKFDQESLTDGTLRTRETLAILAPESEGERPWRSWSRKTKGASGEWVLDRRIAFDGHKTRTVHRERKSNRYEGQIFPYEDYLFVENYFGTILFMQLNGVAENVPISDDLRVHHLENYRVDSRRANEGIEVFNLLGGSSKAFGTKYRAKAKVSGKPDFMLLEWNADYAKGNNKTILEYEIKEVKRLDNIAYPARGHYRDFGVGHGADTTYDFEVISVRKIGEDERTKWLPSWPPETNVSDHTR